MKQAITLIAIVIFFLGSLKVRSQEAWFLFDGNFSGETFEYQVLSRGMRMIFLSDIVNAFQKEFPCARVTYLGDVSMCLEEMQLWGTPAFGRQDVGPKIKKMLNQLNNSDYWVTYCIYPVSETVAIAELKCSDIKGKKLVQFSIKLDIATFFDKDFIEPVNKFVKELSKYEICPYVGSMNFEIKSERTEKTSDAYPVYCNGADKQYKKDVEINDKSEASWKLIKTDKYLTEGNLTYTLREESITSELNECYSCPSGRKGARVYTEKIIQTANIEGLSLESVSKGKNIPDARTEITFLEDGTYTIHVKAASKKGDLKVKTEKHAEGTCDVINQPPITTTQKADVPLNVTLGPFPGSGLDKVLSQNGSYQTVDPVTKEKTTITYNFNLKRD